MLPDAIFRAVVWLDEAPFAALALIWFVASLALGGLWSIACGRDRDRVRGIDGEEY